MALDGVFEAIEALGYFGSFWTFVFSRRFRTAVLADWRARGVGGKLAGLLEATVATVVGLGPFVLAGYLIVR
jgi:hypothetical protein